MTYRGALQTLIHGNPVLGLYTDNASAPLQAHAGLRYTYKWGLYSYCAYVEDGKRGICSHSRSAGRRFDPFDTITSDMPSNYSIISSPFIPDGGFHDARYLGRSSNAAYWMFILGEICAALTLFS